LRFRTSDFVEVVEVGGTRGTADSISGVWIPEPRGAAAKIGGGVLKLKENIFRRQNCQKRQKNSHLLSKSLFDLCKVVKNETKRNKTRK
jgi:hypothetical protein